MWKDQSKQKKITFKKQLSSFLVINVRFRFNLSLTNLNVSQSISNQIYDEKVISCLPTHLLILNLKEWRRKQLSSF